MRACMCIYLFTFYNNNFYWPKLTAPVNTTNKNMIKNYNLHTHTEEEWTQIQLLRLFVDAIYINCIRETCHYTSLQPPSESWQSSPSFPLLIKCLTSPRTLHISFKLSRHSFLSAKPGNCVFLSCMIETGL